MKEVVEAFAFKGKWESIQEFGDGHINDTYRLDFGGNCYLLQRINHYVFTKPNELMENVVRVTEHLREKIEEEGGDPNRETLSVILTKDGKQYFKDRNDLYWRAYNFIENSQSFNLVKDPNDFYESGLAFGRFQAYLADFPIETLNYTIEDFHNTPKRYETFEKAVMENKSGRAHLAKDEIDFVKERKDFTSVLWDAYEKNKIPLKVTHNDTKLNNVLFDCESNKALCVVDLDTVMPGFSLDDFGDAIRFGASTALEDEKDLSKVELDLTLYEQFTKGFIEGAQGTLALEEIALFPEAAKVITLETGIRFLTDFLDGDNYFKTQYADHNLVRAKTQFKLVEEMEKNWDFLKAISEKYQ